MKRTKSYVGIMKVTERRKLFITGNENRCSVVWMMNENLGIRISFGKNCRDGGFRVFKKNMIKIAKFKKSTKCRRKSEKELNIEKRRKSEIIKFSQT